MAANAKTYVFGDFRFIPTESLLLKGDEAVRLSPKALNVLERLVENAGNLVTKDELIRDVWDDMAIEESAVPRTVFLVRTALGDDPKNHSFIQTVPKRGYRFVAEVSTVNGSNGREIRFERDEEDPRISAGNLPSVSAVAPRRFSTVHLAGVFIVLAALATVGAYIGFFGAAPDPNKPTVLVMPVTFTGNENGDDLLEIGIADALIYHLASSKDITVRPLSATRSYTGKAIDPIQAGREHKVNKVISATYQRADGKLRVLARLIDVETGETEERYKSETGETQVFLIQDAIAADLGKNIAQTLGVETSAVPVHGTTNEEAYRHYFQGMALYDLRNGVKAVESFDRAIELDPNFARAWAGKAVALGAMPALGNSTSPELYEKTVQAANQALVLDPGSADAYSALCGAKLVYVHDLSGAEQDCSKAVELGPNSAIVLQSYAFLLVSLGRTEEGLQTVNKALDIEPRSVYSQRLYAQILYLSRKYDLAYAQFVRLNELQPDRLPTYEWTIRTLEASGREPEAMDWMLKSLNVRKADDALIGRIKRAYQVDGWKGVLRERIATDKSSMNHFRQAGLNARLGNKDAAFELLEKAYEERSPIFLTFRAEPQFDALRDDPRFEDLIRRVDARR